MRILGIRLPFDDQPTNFKLRGDMNWTTYLGLGKNDILRFLVTKCQTVRTSFSKRYETNMGHYSLFTAE